MSRDIRCRGKSAESHRGTADCPTGKGEWAYGSLFCDPRDDSCHIFDEELKYWVRVDPATVGQFTGLKDKNGREIYEGDVMEIPETDFNARIVGTVAYDEDSFAIQSRYSGSLWGLSWSLRKHDAGILGNIHDNPELLKEA